MLSLNTELRMQLAPVSASSVLVTEAIQFPLSSYTGAGDPALALTQVWPVLHPLAVSSFKF